MCRACAFRASLSDSALRTAWEVADDRNLTFTPPMPSLEREHDEDDAGNDVQHNGPVVYVEVDVLRASQGVSRSRTVFRLTGATRLQLTS